MMLASSSLPPETKRNLTLHLGGFVNVVLHVWKLLPELLAQKSSHFSPTQVSNKATFYDPCPGRRLQ